MLNPPNVSAFFKMTPDALDKYYMADNSGDNVG